jgi:hypothetical protein
MSGPNAISQGFGETPPPAAPAKPLRPDGEAPDGEAKQGPKLEGLSLSPPGLGQKVDIQHSRANFPFLRPLGERVKRAFNVLG